MVDIHSHILPFIDDGAKTKEETYHMLHIAIEEGITHIIASPHYIKGLNNYNKEKLACTFQSINDYIADKKMKLNIYLGNEVLIEEDILMDVDTQKIEYLAGSQYMLIELLNAFEWENIKNLIFELKLRGIKPIVAHIERYPGICDDKSKLEYLISEGCYIQINASSIISSIKKIKKRTRMLLSNEYVHFVATDSHSNRSRAPLMRQAYEKVEGLYGKVYADEIFVTNGLKVINNEHILTEVSREKNKTLLGRNIWKSKMKK